MRGKAASVSSRTLAYAKCRVAVGARPAWLEHRSEYPLLRGQRCVARRLEHNRGVARLGQVTVAVMIAMFALAPAEQGFGAQPLIAEEQS